MPLFTLTLAVPVGLQVALVAVTLITGPAVLDKLTFCVTVHPPAPVTVTSKPPAANPVAVAVVDTFGFHW